MRLSWFWIDFSCDIVLYQLILLWVFATNNIVKAVRFSAFYREAINFLVDPYYHYQVLAYLMIMMISSIQIVICMASVLTQHPMHMHSIHSMWSDMWYVYTCIHTYYYYMHTELMCHVYVNKKLCIFNIIIRLTAVS